MFLFLDIPETTIEFTASPAVINPGATEKLTLLCQLNVANPILGHVTMRRRDVTSHSRDTTDGQVVADEDTSVTNTTFSTITNVIKISITRKITGENVADIFEHRSEKQYTEEQAEVTADLYGGLDPDGGPDLNGGPGKEVRA